MALRVIQWVSPPPTIKRWAESRLSGFPVFTAAQGVVDGVPVFARMEPEGITVYRRGSLGDTTTVVEEASKGPSFLEMAGFGFLAFSTSFGIAWAFFKGEEK